MIYELLNNTAPILAKPHKIINKKLKTLAASLIKVRSQSELNA